MSPEKVYRYHDYVTNVGVHVGEYEYKVLKETPRGYWIQLYPSRWENRVSRKWVNKYSKKRFAYPSKEEALASFLARKRRQIQILQSQLDRAKVALSIKSQRTEVSPMNSLFKRIFNIEV